MNAVEIEEAISALAEQPFDPEESPFAFLEPFGNKATTTKRSCSATPQAYPLSRGRPVTKACFNARFQGERAEIA